MQIRFVYSISNSIGAGKSFLQMHEQVQIIAVDGVTDANGNPSYQQLVKAEITFFDWFLNNKPNGYLLGYVTGPADGSKGRYSEYNAYLPA